MQVKGTDASGSGKTKATTTTTTKKTDTTSKNTTTNTTATKATTTAKTYSNPHQDGRITSAPATSGNTGTSGATTSTKTTTTTDTKSTLSPFQQMLKGAGVINTNPLATSKSTGTTTTTKTYSNPHTDGRISGTATSLIQPTKGVVTDKDSGTTENLTATEMSKLLFQNGLITSKTLPETQTTIYSDTDMNDFQKLQTSNMRAISDALTQERNRLTKETEAKTAAGQEQDSSTEQKTSDLQNLINKINVGIDSKYSMSNLVSYNSFGLLNSDLTLQGVSQENLQTIRSQANAYEEAVNTYEEMYAAYKSGSNEYTWEEVEFTYQNLMNQKKVLESSLNALSFTEGNVLDINFDGMSSSKILQSVEDYTHACEVANVKLNKLVAEVKNADEEYQAAYDKAISSRTEAAWQEFYEVQNKYFDAYATYQSESVYADEIFQNQNYALDAYYTRQEEELQQLYEDYPQYKWIEEIGMVDDSGKYVLTADLDTILNKIETSDDEQAEFYQYVLDNKISSGEFELSDEEFDQYLAQAKEMLDAAEAAKVQNTSALHGFGENILDENGNISEEYIQANDSSGVDQQLAAAQNRYNTLLSMKATKNYNATVSSLSQKAQDLLAQYQQDLYTSANKDGKTSTEGEEAGKRLNDERTQLLALLETEMANSDIEADDIIKYTQQSVNAQVSKEKKEQYYAESYDPEYIELKKKYTELEREALNLSSLGNDSPEYQAALEAQNAALDELNAYLTSGGVKCRNGLENFFNHVVSGMGSAGGYLDLIGQKLGTTDTNKYNSLTGEKWGLDYNTVYENSYYKNQAIAEAQFQRSFDRVYENSASTVKAYKMAQLESNIFGLASSMTQSALNAGLASLCPVTGAVGLILMGTESATATTMEAHENGYSDGAALTLGLISGLAEVATESFSLEKFLETKNVFKTLSKTEKLKTLGLNMLYQGLAEGSEEGASDVLNLLADYIIAEFDTNGITTMERNALATVQEAKLNGKADEQTTFEQAMEEEYKSWMNQLAQDIAGGFASGVLMGSAGAAISSAITNSNIKAHGQKILDRDAAGGDTTANLGVNALLELANDADAVINSSLKEYGLDNGIDVTDAYQVGLLDIAIRDIDLSKSVETKLESMGEEASTDLVRAIVAKSGVTNGGESTRLTLEQSKALRNSTNAKEIISDLRAAQDGKGSEWASNAYTSSLWASQTVPMSMARTPEMDAQAQEIVQSSNYSTSYLKSRAYRLGYTGSAAEKVGRVIQSGVISNKEVSEILADDGLRNAFNAQMSSEHEGWTNLEANTSESKARQQVRQYLADANSEVTQEYVNTVLANPDANVLDQLGTELADAGVTNSDKLFQQKKVLAKLMSGETLSVYDIRALDLNDPAVRTVFANRVGYTNMPNINYSYTIKKAYVENVQEMVGSVIQAQAGLGDAAETLAGATVARQQSKKRSTTKGSGKRAENIRRQNEQKTSAYIKRQEELTKAGLRKLNTEGMSEDEIAELVKETFGLAEKPMTFREFAAEKGYNLDKLNAVTYANLLDDYERYLRQLGVRGSGIKAMMETFEAHIADEMGLEVKTGSEYGLQLDGQITPEQLVQAGKIDKRTLYALDCVGKALDMKIRFGVIEPFWIDRATGKRVNITDKEGRADPNKYKHVQEQANVNRETREILVNVNNREPIQVTVFHEIVHQLKKDDVKSYNALKEVLFSVFGKESKFYQDIYAKEAGLYLDKDLEEELVCQMIGELFNNDKVLSRFVRSGVKESRTLKKGLTGIREKINKVNRETVDLGGQQYALDTIDEIIDALNKAIKEASAVAKKANTAKTAENDTKESLVSISEGLGLEIEYDKETKELIRDKDGNVIVRKDGKRIYKLSEEDIIGTPIGDLIQLSMTKTDAEGNVEWKGTISKDDAKKERQMFAELYNMILDNKDTELVWSVVGTEVFSAITTNKDAQYWRTIDMSTICKKSQAIIDAMSVAMKRLHRGLTREEIEDIYLAVGEEGYQTPCPVCYVFSHWFGVGGILSQVKKYQDLYGDMSEAELVSFVDKVRKEMLSYAKAEISKNPNYKAKITGADGEYLISKLVSDKKKKIGDRIESIENKLLEHDNYQKSINEKSAALEGADAKSTKAIQKEIKAIEKKMNAINVQELTREKEAEIAEMEHLEGYQFVVKSVLDKKTLKRRSTFKKVPDEILFDLNRTDEFVVKYKDVWGFRNGKGAAAGKTMQPYADARVGEAIQGMTTTSNSVANIKKGNLNPFLHNRDEDTIKSIILAARSIMAGQNLIGGMRFQSTSDFRYEYGTDYLITLLEMQAVGANVQLYTKVVEAIDFLASSGADVNCSVMPWGDGYKVNDDESVELLYSSITGINKDAAVIKSRQYDNVQLILVGINDENIKWALRGTDVTFVIPFHGSGQSVEQIARLMKLIQENLDVYQAKDYTNLQEDKEDPNSTKDQIALRELRKNIVSGVTRELSKSDLALLDRNEDAKQFIMPLFKLFNDKSSKYYGNYIRKDAADKIFPYEYWDKTSTYDTAYVNRNNFFKYCKALGLIPRFTGQVVRDKKVVNVGFGDFSKEDNYWKLLIDRRMYANKYDENGNWIGYGKYRDQQSINIANMEVDMITPAYGEKYFGDEGETVRNAKVKEYHGKTDETKAKINNAVDRALKRGQERTDADVKQSLIALENTDRYFTDPSMEKTYQAIAEQLYVGALYYLDDKSHKNLFGNYWEYVSRATNKIATANGVDKYLGGVGKLMFSLVRENQTADYKVLDLLMGALCNTESYKINTILKALGDVKKNDNSLLPFVNPSLQQYINKALQIRDEFFKRLREGRSIDVKKEEPMNQGIELSARTIMNTKQLRELFDKLNSNEELTELADRIFPVAERLGVVAKGATLNRKGADTYTYGHAHTNRVILDRPLFKSTNISDQVKAQTVLHETIHTVTVSILNYYKRFIEGDLSFDNKLLEKGDLHLSKTQIEGCEAVFKLYETAKKDPDFNGLYGMKTVYEFVAELSNPEFRATLQKKSLLERLLDAIKRLLGFEPKNMLEATNEALNKIICFDKDGILEEDLDSYNSEMNVAIESGFIHIIGDRTHWLKGDNPSNFEPNLKHSYSEIVDLTEKAVKNVGNLTEADELHMYNYYHMVSDLYDARDGRTWSESYANINDLDIDTMSRAEMLSYYEQLAFEPGDIDDVIYADDETLRDELKSLVKEKAEFGEQGQTVNTQWWKLGDPIEVLRYFVETENDTKSSLSEAPVSQAISSANTSIKQIPALFTNPRVKFEGTNIDIGGGRFDLATDFLAEQGVRNLVFDPYNRPDEVNRATLDFLMSGNKADTATCANVLNVISERGARDNVILEVAKSIKDDGVAYFMVYEGDGTGVGKETKAGYQNNRMTSTYVEEIEEYFDNVARHGKLIEAREPKANLPEAAWETTPGTAIKYSRAEIKDDKTAQRIADIKQKAKEEKAQLKQTAKEEKAQLSSELRAAVKDAKVSKKTADKLAQDLKKVTERAEKAEAQVKKEQAHVQFQTGMRNAEKEIRAFRDKYRAQELKNIFRKKGLPSAVYSDKVLDTANRLVNKETAAQQKRDADKERREKAAAVDKVWRDALNKGKVQREKDAIREKAKAKVKEARASAVSSVKKIHKARVDYRNRAAVDTSTERNGITNLPRAQDDPHEFIERAKAQAAREDIHTGNDMVDAFYRTFVNATTDLDQMAKLQSRMDNISVMINMVRASKSTAEQFKKEAMFDKAGNIIGESMNDTFLCYDKDGKYNEDMQDMLNQYMFYMHTVDRMSIKEKAAQRVEDMENKYPFLATMTDKELLDAIRSGNQFVLEYARVLSAYKRAKDKPVLKNEDGTAMTAAQAQAGADALLAEAPWLEDKANIIWDWWDTFMLEWGVGQSLSMEDYQYLHEFYPHYVPTFRVKDKNTTRLLDTSDTSMTGKHISADRVTREAVGSTADLLRMEDQFATSADRIIKLQRANQLKQNIVEELMMDEDGTFAKWGYFDWSKESEETQAEWLGHTLTDKEEEELWDFAGVDNLEDMEAKATGEDRNYGWTMSCWIDGKRYTAEISTGLAKGLNFLFDKNNEVYKKMVKLGNALTGPMKTMITGANPFFAIKNTLRDDQTAINNSIAGWRFPEYKARAYSEMMAHSDKWLQFQALGGVSSQYTTNEGGVAKAWRKKQNVVGKTMDVLGTPGEISESSTRFAEYLAAIDKYGDTEEGRMKAIRCAAEVTVDFGRRGTAGTLINAFIPYWNPQIQGIDKMIRQVVEQGSPKGIAKQLARTIVVNALPQAISILLCAGLKGDRRKEWEELSDQIKDNYYVFPIPWADNKFLKIPKSQDWAALISTPILRCAEGWFFDREDNWDNFFQTCIMANYINTNLPIGLDWHTELLKNENYNGSRIIPYELEDASKREQWDADTSSVAFALSRAMGSIMSPEALDYIIHDYMGSFYYGLMNLFIPSMGTMTGETTFAEGLADHFSDFFSTITSPFIVDSRYSNLYTSQYYDLKAELTQAITDAGTHGGDATETLEYKIDQALSVSGGLYEQIRELTNEINATSDTEERNELKEVLAGLCLEATTFIRQCQKGEIDDPVVYATYHRYGDAIYNEVSALISAGLDTDFDFSGAIGSSGTFYNPNDKSQKYVLEGTEYEQMYQDMKTEEYIAVLNEVINSEDYKTAETQEQKAAYLEEAKDQAMEQAAQRLLHQLTEDGVSYTSIVKADYDLETEAAAYGVAQILGTEDALNSAVTDELIRLYDDIGDATVGPLASTRKTFTNLDDDSLIYVLTDEDNDVWKQIAHDAYDELMTSLVAGEDYQTAGSNALQVRELEKMRDVVEATAKEKFQEYLDTANVTWTKKDEDPAVVSLEARFAVERASDDDQAFPTSITDEWIDLFEYSKSGGGDYTDFFDLPNASATYVNTQNRAYKFQVDTVARAAYQEIAYDVYIDWGNELVASERYQKASQDEKAKMWYDLRVELTDEVRPLFITWMNENGTPQVLR